MKVPTIAVPFSTLRGERNINLQLKVNNNLISFYGMGKLILVSCINLNKLNVSRRLIKTALKSQYILLIIVGNGESYKSLSCCKSMLRVFQKERIKKKDGVLALGGGVIGDLTGFLASCYMRGIKLTHLPTTLLSQTDSSIGGKTGLNTSLGKNILGSFYFADDVIDNLSMLRSLPPREWSTGLCEIIKVSICTDVTFFHWLEVKSQEILCRKANVILNLVKRSCELKSFVVTKDNRENGMRSVLNFGHTFGHAIELSLSFAKWTHGEAVGCGMALAIGVSLSLGLISSAIRGRLLRLLSLYNLPISPPSGLDVCTLVNNMKTDKKNLSRFIDVVLLRDIADPIIISLTAEQLRKVITRC